MVCTGAAGEKNMGFSVNCPEGLTISCDVSMTSEALFNLLDNAVKYTPEGEASADVQNGKAYLKID